MPHDAKKEAVQSASLNKPITDELIMKITKEVVIKFIEVGRLSPPKFAETFQEVYRTVSDVARGSAIDKEGA